MDDVDKQELQVRVGQQGALGYLDHKGPQDPSGLQGLKDHQVVLDLAVPRVHKEQQVQLVTGELQERLELLVVQDSQEQMVLQVHRVLVALQLQGLLGHQELLGLRGLTVPGGR